LGAGRDRFFLAIGLITGSRLYKENRMMKLRPRRKALHAALAGAACIALLQCLPAIASAATTIGADMTHNSPQDPSACTNDSSVPACDFAPFTEGGAAQVAPANGVVVRWRVEDASGPLALRVIRPGPPGQYLFVSSSVTELPFGTGVATFGTRQPINAGDYIGVELQSPTTTIGLDNIGKAPGASVALWAGPLADGTSATPAGTVDTARGYVNADIEPDADRDGFGDETQDLCPSNASTQGPCPPPPPPPDTTAPALTASAQGATLSKHGAISFFVSSSENATGSAGGTISLPKLARTVRFAARKLTLTAGTRRKVTLRLSKKNAKLADRALANHRKLKAKVTLSVKDAAGNASVKALSLRLRRPHA
jgi:hypothetical protein